MTAQQTLVARLTSDATLTALIGDRLWPDLTRQDPPFPFVLYQRANTDRLTGLGGPKRTNMHTVEVDVFAATAAAAETIVGVIVDRLNGWVDRTAGVLGCFVEESDSKEFESPGGVHRSNSVQARVWFRDAA